MDNPFIGTIAKVGFNFAPVGWLPCDGRLLPISSYDALFSLLGTTYGGDGQTTFGLPDLRGRSPIGFGQGPGLSNYDLGQVVGSETVTITVNQLPAHGHTATLQVTAARAGNPAPTSAMAYGGATDHAGNVANLYGTSDGTTMNATIGFAGGGQPHDNMMPYLAINYIIAVEGLWPSQS